MKCISFFKTRLKKPFHRCNFRTTNNSLESDCVIFLCNVNSDAIGYILERMEISHLFFGKELQEIKRVKYDAQYLSDIIINIEYAFDEMQVRIEPLQLFIRQPEMSVLDWQVTNENTF